MRLCNVKNVVAALIDCSKRQQLQLQATLDRCCHADVSVGLLSALVEVDSSLSVAKLFLSFTLGNGLTAVSP